MTFLLPPPGGYVLTGISSLFCLLAGLHTSTGTELIFTIFDGKVRVDNAGYVKRYSQGDGGLQR